MKRASTYKILFANGSQTLQGDTKVALQTLKSLADIARIRILTVSGGAADAFEQEIPGAEVQRFPEYAIRSPLIRRGTQTASSFARVLYEVFSYRPDALYTYDRTMISPILCAIGILSRTPFIYHITNGEMFQHQKFRYKMVSRAAAIWSMSEFIKRQALSNHVQGRHDVLLGCYTDSPVSMTKQEARQQLGIPEGQTVLAMVGRLSPFKGQDTLLEALAEPPLRDTNVHAYIAGLDNGDGNFLQPKIPDFAGHLQQRARDLGVAERVTFLGQRPGQLVFRAADIAAIPSVAEPFGLIVPEAISSGVPIVATDSGSFPELLRHNESALLVPVRDPRRLAEAIRAYYDDPARAQSLARTATADVLPRLSPERYQREAQSKFLAVMQRTRR